MWCCFSSKSCNDVFALAYLLTYHISLHWFYFLQTCGAWCCAVGGPLETSCKLEGMLQSVLGKQQEMQRKLNEISNLAIGLKQKIILEQDQPEEVPVISPPIINESGEVILTATDGSNTNNIDAGAGVQNDSGPHPCTPTKATAQSHSHSPVGGSDGVGSVTSACSTAVELGTAPRTPCPSSHTPGSYMEDQMGAHLQQFVHSPAHSCPMPTNNVHLNQPFLDDRTPTGTGVLRYRVNSDDDMSGLGWAGVLGCGSSLFGERLIESSRGGETSAADNIFNTATNGLDILALSFDDNSLMQQSNTQRRAARALAAVAAGSSARVGGGGIEISGSADSPQRSEGSPLRRGGSFDGGVNFRTGMSGHRGLGKPKREQQLTHHNTINNNNNNAMQQPRRMLMMSQHRGAATVRGGAKLQQRRSTTDSMVGQTIR